MKIDERCHDMKIACYTCHGKMCRIAVNNYICLSCADKYDIDKEHETDDKTDEDVHCDNEDIDDSCGNEDIDELKTCHICNGIMVKLIYRFMIKFCCDCDDEINQYGRCGRCRTFIMLPDSTYSTSGYCYPCS